MNKDLILAIDTSCDDTSFAVLRGSTVLSSVVSSQVEIHAQWGGVVPDIARREHEKNIPVVYIEALRKARVDIEDIDYVACTYGPGLAIDLEVGLTFAKELAIKENKRFVAINHMEGHLLSGLLHLGSGEGQTPTDGDSPDNRSLLDVGPDLGQTLFPALGLLVSGKHTEIVHVRDFGVYAKLGETLDDAAGEAFDKVARMLNLGYPGGPVICDFARRGTKGKIVLPIPMERSNNLNFSYSGLKTASLYKIKELRENGLPEKEWVYDFCRSFLDVIKESISIKLERAIQENGDIKSVFVGGGVFNSEEITRYIGKLVRSYGLRYIYPKQEYRGDNAAMIGIAAYYHIIKGDFIEKKEEIEKIDREPRLSIEAGN